MPTHKNKEFRHSCTADPIGKPRGTQPKVQLPRSSQFHQQPNSRAGKNLGFYFVGIYAFLCFKVMYYIHCFHVQVPDYNHVQDNSKAHGWHYQFIRIHVKLSSLCSSDIFYILTYQHPMSQTRAGLSSDNNRCCLPVFSFEMDQTIFVSRST